MKLNQKAIDLIKSFEGLELKAYKDAVNVLTIGYGHTSMAGDPKVTPGMVITAQEAEAILVKDLQKYEGYVRQYVKVDLNDNQYGALVSFVYNLGPGNFKKSTLLKKVNTHDFTGAALEFAKWNKAGGKVLKGLTRRRAAEAALFKMPAFLPSEPVHPLPDVPAPEPKVEEKTSQWASLGQIITMILKLLFRR